MAGNSEKLPVIIKPHVDRATALDIVYFFEDRLKDSGVGFRRIAGTRTKLPREFWEEFYLNVKEKGYPEVYEKMVNDFSNCIGDGLDGLTGFIFYWGQQGLAQTAKDICGPTFPKRFGKNCKTIREYFGNPKMGHRTLMHVPNPDELYENLNLLRKYRVIPCGKIIA